MAFVLKQQSTGRSKYSSIYSGTLQCDGKGTPGILQTVSAAYPAIVHGPGVGVWAKDKGCTCGCHEVRAESGAYELGVSDGTGGQGCHCGLDQELVSCFYGHEVQSSFYW